MKLTFKNGDPKLVADFQAYQQQTAWKKANKHIYLNISLGLNVALILFMIFKHFHG